MTTLRWCGSCADERPFEQPPCGDNHELDCPDWCCVECGSAVFIGDAGLEPTAPLAASAA